MSDTPETDDLFRRNLYVEQKQLADFARKLERERDELRERLSAAKREIERLNIVNSALDESKENAELREIALRLMDDKIRLGALSEQLYAEVATLQAQLSRICKEGFNYDDTIGGEPADDYVLRQIGKLKAIDEKPDAT